MKAIFALVGIAMISTVSVNASADLADQFHSRSSRHAKQVAADNVENVYLSAKNAVEWQGKSKVVSGPEIHPRQSNDQLWYYNMRNGTICSVVVGLGQQGEPFFAFPFTVSCE